MFARGLIEKALHAEGDQGLVTKIKNTTVFFVLFCFVFCFFFCRYTLKEGQLCPFDHFSWFLFRLLCFSHSMHYHFPPSFLPSLTPSPPPPPHWFAFSVRVRRGERRRRRSGMKEHHRPSTGGPSWKKDFSLPAFLSSRLGLLGETCSWTGKGVKLCLQC